MAQHDLYRDKIEVSLDGRQIFSLFFAGAVIICTVFVIGVMVGKRVEARAHIDRAAALPGDPLAALDKLESEAPLTFRSALRHGQAAAGSVDLEIAALAKAQRATEESAKRSADTAAKTAAAEPATDQATSKGKDSSAKSSKDKAQEEPARAERAVVESESSRDDEPATKEKTAKEQEKSKDREKEKDKDKDKDKSDSKKARYTLQLSSFQERAEAESFLVELRAAGYAPTLTQAEVEGRGTFFRVRLGSYPSYDSAVEAKQEFERKVSRIAYVTKL